MIFPALDAVTEHVYINIGPPLGTGSGNARVNAKGVTSINNYFYLERNYNLVTNKKHRVVHVVGLDSIKDNRTGDAGVPSTMVNADYFYDVYYEVDGVYGSFGCALPFVRIFNLHATTITHGSSAAYSKQYYINPKVETTFANPSYAMLSVYMGGSIIARGQLHLINPLLVNTGTAFKIKRLTGVGNTNETYIYGGAIVGKGYTSTSPLIDYFSDNGEKLFIYNTAINIDNATTKIVEPTSGYVDGANIPEVRITNCTFKNASMNVDPKTTSTNNTFGVLPEDVFTNYETNNFLAPAGIYSNSGLDLTTLPVYGWTDYENWNIGLREAEPLPGAIIVNSLTSILGSKTIRPGVSFTITLTGDIGDTPGTVILKNSLQTSQLSFTIDSWNNVTKEIVCTVPVSYNVRYNDSDALIFITRADGEPLSPYGGVTYLAPVGVQTRLGELFSTALGSIFNNAVTPPSGTYQIQWRDPDNTGAIILANGIIDSISTSGSIFVRIYDETDSSISDEVQIVLYIVAVTSGLTVRIGGTTAVTVENFSGGVNAGTLDDIALTSASDTSITVKGLVDTQTVPRLGSQTLTLTNGADSVNVTVEVLPPTGFGYIVAASYQETINGIAVSYLPVAATDGHFILYPKTPSAGKTTKVTNSGISTSHVGNQTLWIVDASTKVARSFVVTTTASAGLLGGGGFGGVGSLGIGI